MMVLLRRVLPQPFKHLPHILGKGRDKLNPFPGPRVGERQPVGVKGLASEFLHAAF